jgi:hypothetical protein
LGVVVQTLDLRVEALVLGLAQQCAALRGVDPGGEERQQRPAGLVFAASLAPGNSRPYQFIPHRPWDQRGSSW